jgi:hypothetical protein
MADVARLRKVLDHIKALPRYDHAGIAQYEDQAAHLRGDGWYQSDWLLTDDEVTITECGVVDRQGRSCGTAGCFAGWAVLLFAPDGTRMDGDCVTLPDGTPTHVSDYAARLLGLTPSEAGCLFTAWNTMGVLETTVADIEAGSCDSI